jgi:hypothetical protein
MSEPTRTEVENEIVVRMLRHRGHWHTGRMPLACIGPETFAEVVVSPDCSQIVMASGPAYGVRGDAR